MTVKRKGCGNNGDRLAKEEGEVSEVSHLGGDISVLARNLVEVERSS